MPLSPDFITSRVYEERVYAAVLGKIIGVYLGRPFEGWWNERIEKELGEVWYYVHEQLGQPLIVTDDDISGTFTFLRALPENGNDPHLTAAQIGDWWLNTIIEHKTILWWGGLGMSTEHTAYQRLKNGLKAPASGSIATNGTTVAEQIGAQIFIDGWGLICPGDPERAAALAGKAASVSHDGEAKYGAQVIAALEAAAFAEPDLQALLDIAGAQIPRDSVIFRLIQDARAWAADSGDNWRATFRKIQQNYGYDKFPGNCHMVPNHAVILLALLHADDDFQKGMMIANTAGWDTDCNAGNVGCILGVKNGLASIDGGPDWRGPVADRLYLPTADGARAITDAVRETFEIVNIARALAGQPPAAPKNGARFHFSLPGSVQGFRPEDSPEAKGVASASNADGRLSVRLDGLTTGRAARVTTATFTPTEALKMGGYSLIATPTLSPGQTVTATVEASDDLTGPVEVGLYGRSYCYDDSLRSQRGPIKTLAPGQSVELSWTVPDLDGQPMAEIGIEATAARKTDGTLRLDRLTWSGTPTVTYKKPAEGGNAWRQAWVLAASEQNFDWIPGGQFCRLTDNHQTGLALVGEWSWTGYTASTTVTPHLAKRIGLAGAVRGLRRYVALVLDEDKTVRLIEQRDDERRVLAESSAQWEYEQPATELSLTITPGRVTARYGDATLEAVGDALPARGGVGLLVDTGMAEFGPVSVRPA